MRAEPRHEHLLQAPAERPAEFLARQRDDDRDLAPVQILANQDADPAVLLELQQADDEPAELLGRGLEQLVTREGLEELDDLLVVVRTGDQVLGRDDQLELVVQ